jgi:hypothetical protein
VTIIGSETTICASTNTSIEFLTEFGDLPLLILDISLLADISTGHITYYLANITAVQDGKLRHPSMI